MGRLQFSQVKHVMLHCVRPRTANTEPFLALFYAILNYMLHGHEYLYPVFEYHSLNICKLHVDLLLQRTFSLFYNLVTRVTYCQ